MTGHVLVLNADYSPLSISPLYTVTWKDAIKLVWLNQVNVVEYYENWVVHSPKLTFQVPSVLAAKQYVKASRVVKFNKFNLCIRDDFSCQYCFKEFDSKQLTMDHVIPKILGGKKTFDNIVMSCKECNSRKGHRMDMLPKIRPFKPTIGEITSKIKKRPIVIPDSNWIPYIGWNPNLITVKFDCEKKINDN